MHGYARVPDELTDLRYTAEEREGGGDESPLKVIDVPVEDLRNVQPTRRNVEPITLSIGQEPKGLIVRLRIQPVGDVCLVSKRREADRCAVEREVDTGIVISTPGRGACLAQ